MIPPPTGQPQRFAASTAFTLVELLVSMTVLTLLIVAVSQMVSGTTTISTSNRQHLDADGQARLVFDRMALDFARMVKRPDVDYIFKDASVVTQPGNDKFFFYSEAPAYFDPADDPAAATAAAQSSLALIGYRINSATQANPYQLARLSKGLTWDESSGSATDPLKDPAPGSIVFLSYPAASPSPAAAPTPFPASTLAGHWPQTLGSSPGYNGDDPDPLHPSYHVISPQVCRLEICYLLKPAVQSDGTTLPAVYSLSPFRAPHTSISGLQDVRAIVVALVVLDQTSRQIAPDLSHLTAAFPDIAADGTGLGATPPILMAKMWQDKLDSGTVAATAQIPQAAAGQLRIYQRHFYLDTQ
jgi:type II secretory pathway pseudopilin PulG